MNGPAPNQRSHLPASTVLISIFGFWLFYALVVTLRAMVMDFPLQDQLAQRRIFVIVAGMIVTIIVWQILKLADRRPLWQRIAMAATVCIPAALVIAHANYYIFNIYDQETLLDIERIRKSTGFQPSFWVEIVEVAISRYFFLIAWSSLYLALGYAHSVRFAERRAAAFERAAQLSELRALRYQLNPHFLFNTLNSLSALVMTGRQAEAESMILNLADFYRNSLTSDPSGDIPLADEFEVQRLYLEIEKVRFPSRLSTHFDLPDELSRLAVPGLILQPLVENAVKHGVAKSSLPVRISLSAKTENGQLVLTVENDGPDPKADNPAGIGQTNVKDRLFARYGNGAKASLAPRAGGGYRATLSFPLVNHG
jgi:two-component system, LytTR family, sensor kinase